MSRDKQIEEMAEIISSSVCIGVLCSDCEFEGKPGCFVHHKASSIYNAGYRKSSEVALKAVDDFQRRLRHIFLDMCNGNDYDTLNLLQIDSAIEALYDAFVAELKKK